MRALALSGLVGLALAAFAAPAGAVVWPRITAAHLSQRGQGAPGPNYQVLVSARQRVCAAKGRLTLLVRERKYLGDLADPLAEHFRRRRVRHARRCQWHTFQWVLGERFFGVGTYSVRMKVRDRYGRESRAVFRSSTTLD